MTYDAPPDDHPRLGFCSTFVSPDGDAELGRAMNMKAVTLASLAKLTPAEAFDKVAGVVAHNLEALHRQIRYVAGRQPLERLHRIQSSLLPVYNHQLYRAYYDDADLRTLLERGLASAGELAREAGVRLSMHPSQFCVIASANPAAVENGIAEMHYHADVMTMMGYGSGWHPHGAHVNIHGGGRVSGAEGFREGLKLLSETARNLITVENDEVSYGLEDLLPLADALPIVLDLHHHWVKSQGEYIQPDDPRMRAIRDSWRGTRPLMHISAPRESFLAGHDPATLPDFAVLSEAGVSARDLRGHSDMMFNGAINELVARHLVWSDFEVEAKMKNLASAQIAAAVAPSLGLAPVRPALLLAG